MNTSFSMLIACTSSMSTPTLAFAIVAPLASDSIICRVPSMLDLLEFLEGAEGGYMSVLVFFSVDTRASGFRNTELICSSVYGDLSFATKKVLVVRALWK